jgi:HD-GYP domain-containing protein (c-di-GMP phosphodiesterase class II)
MSVADAEAELRANAGTQFEPGAVAALLAELAEGDLTPVNAAGDAPIN